MFDALDLLHGRVNYVFTGSHYPTQPNTPDDEHADFDYEYVDPTEWHYQKLFGNILNNDGATTTIKTNDDMSRKVDQYVALQDNKLYKVVSVMKDYQSANREVFRFLKDAPQIDFVVRLIEEHDGWGIADEI